MKYLYIFLINFTIIYLLYLFLTVLRNKNYADRKVPVEVQVLIKNFKLDITKINYRRLLNTVSIINAFCISVASLFIFNDNKLIQLFLALLILIPLIFICYYLLGMYYKKKEKRKNNV